MWQDLLVGIALVLVFEGIMPFLSPRQYRRTLQMASQMNNGSLRIIGLLSMTFGVVLLYVVR